jgi:hypothetical protein
MCILAISQLHRGGVGKNKKTQQNATIDARDGLMEACGYCRLYEAL